MKTLSISILLLLCLNVGVSQDSNNWKDTFSSSVHPYSITIPKSFTKVTATGKHIDFKFIDEYGSSILVNVSDRLPEEYKITAHDYSKEYLEKMFRNAEPNFTISKSEKILIDSQKAFLFEYTGSISSKLKSMECDIFYKDKAYVITASAPVAKFDNYRNLFVTAIQSIDFK